MATIHPSRLGLVPQEPKDDYAYKRNDRRGRSPSPRYNSRRSPSRTPSRDRGHDRDSKGRNGRDERGEDRRDGERSRRTRARADDYFDGDRGEKAKERSRSVDRERDREREERRGGDRPPRRPSPEYSEYRRPSPPHVREGSAPAPWRQQDNMYPGRRGGMPHAAGSDFLDSRRQQREASTFSIWPPSPKAPARSSPSPDSRRHKKSKKRRRDSSVSSTDSEYERRRRERKERKKSRKEKEKKSKDHRSRRSRSKSARRYDDPDVEEDKYRRSKLRSRSRSEERRRSKSKELSRRSKTRTKSPDEQPPTTDDEDQWVEKPSTNPLSAVSTQSKGKESMGPPQTIPSLSTNMQSTSQLADGDSDDEVGPQPLKVASTSRKVDERQYGGALLRGEGSAMAAFLKDGTDVRIPRRGEIGLTSDEIATFESVGYVMSGSRHRRMNAVRMRKENQVISAEEKRGILQLQKEERERREAILREEFQELVSENLKSGTK